MKQSAFDDFAEGVMEVAYEFTQCRRTDGTIYGTAGDCAQKGAKEVSGQQGNSGTARSTASSNLEKAFGDRKSWGAYKDALKKMDTEALNNTISMVGKEFSSGKGNAENARKVIGEALKARARIAEGEGKKLPTATSVLSKDTIKKMGLDPDVLNGVVTKKGFGDKMYNLNKLSQEHKSSVKSKNTPKTKPKASLTRNASQKEVLDEYRNNLKNGKWTLKQQNYSKSVKESAQRDAVNELVRDGYDPRKILGIFPSLTDHVNSFDYEKSAKPKSKPAQAKPATLSGPKATAVDIKDLKDNVASYKSSGASKSQMKSEIDDYAKYYGGGTRGEAELKKIGYTAAGIKQ